MAQGPRELEVEDGSGHTRLHDRVWPGCGSLFCGVHHTRLLATNSNQRWDEKAGPTRTYVTRERGANHDSRPVPHPP